MLTDTHTHLHFDQYEKDLPAVVQRARQAGVQKILTLGTELHSSRQSIEIASRYEGVYAAVGIHPTDVLKSSPDDIPSLKGLARNTPGVVAIGEIGLDLHWKEVPLKDQLPVLEEMIGIATDLGLPVVIHNRKAQLEMRHFFQNRGINRLRGVMHSFSGSAEDARFYLERGMYISFTGVITFKNFKQTGVLRSVPVERLLLETDCPFLAPEPYRGKRNEPAYVKYVAEKQAKAHGLSYEELCRLTAKNANDLFKWDHS